MRIFVVPRKYIKMYMYTDKFFQHNNFISIGESEGYEGVPVDTDNVLKLVFDDMTDKETDGILFNKDQALKIKDFIDRIDKSKTLYVNCFAGISRSGAVGTVINDYVNFYLNNMKKNEDWFAFFDDNKQIKPNSYVMRIMNKEFGLSY